MAYFINVRRLSRAYLYSWVRGVTHCIYSNMNMVMIEHKFHTQTHSHIFCILHTWNPHPNSLQINLIWTHFELNPKPSLKIANQPLFPQNPKNPNQEHLTEHKPIIPITPFFQTQKEPIKKKISNHGCWHTHLISIL